MYLLAILIAVGILLLGANFSMTLVGGPPWSKKAEFSPISIGGKTLSVEKISIGVTLLILGTLWLATWFYFLFQGWQSFAAQINWLMLHVVLQFLTSVGLLVSGAS
ncbi:MAG: hypothetical protein ACXWQE_14395, partial [Bdellovibrionales bacterium]